MSERPLIATEEWCQEHLNVTNPGDSGTWDWALIADLSVISTASPYTIQSIVEELMEKLAAADILYPEEREKLQEHVEELERDAS